LRIEREKHYIMNIENWEKEKTLHNEYWELREREKNITYWILRIEKEKTLHNVYWELGEKNIT
jgi:hypothetical protein